MATDFGFLPTKEDGAYFISYNSEDSGRVAPIASELKAKGLPLWYDYGLEYGEEWERQIAIHIRSCKAVIMFITKNIFDKEKSYVRKEYEMAVDYYDKRVYVVIMDSINKKAIPEHFLGWWIDLTHLHCITNATSQGIMNAIGFTSQVSTNSVNNTGMSASELNEKGKDYYYGRNGVKQDYSEAVRYYKLAADQGNANAQLNLGYCYENGQGVKQDYSEAVRYYRFAADQGLAWAQYNLGVCYDEGQGVKQDYSEAVRYYRLAADQGLARAQFNLALCYENGKGVKQDYSEAVRYYRLAADQGHAKAQCNLGYCYNNGQGVEKNLNEAIRLYKLSAAQGNETAKNNLKILGVE